jgi:hypothetical protein
MLFRYRLSHCYQLRYCHCYCHFIHCHVLSPLPYVLSLSLVKHIYYIAILRYCHLYIHRTLLLLPRYCHVISTAKTRQAFHSYCHYYFITHYIGLFSLSVLRSHITCYWLLLPFTLLCLLHTYISHVIAICYRYSPFIAISVIGRIIFSYR